MDYASGRYTDDEELRSRSKNKAGSNHSSIWVKIGDSEQFLVLQKLLTVPDFLTWGFDSVDGRAASIREALNRTCFETV